VPETPGRFPALCRLFGAGLGWTQLRFFTRPSTKRFQLSKGLPWTMVRFTQSFLPGNQTIWGSILLTRSGRGQTVGGIGGGWRKETPSSSTPAKVNGLIQRAFPCGSQLFWSASSRKAGFKRTGKIRASNYEQKDRWFLGVELIRKALLLKMGITLRFVLRIEPACFLPFVPITGICSLSFAVETPIQSWPFLLRFAQIRFCRKGPVIPQKEVSKAPNVWFLWVRRNSAEK